MDPRTLQRVMDQRLAGALLAGLLMTLSSCAERAQYPPAVEVEASPGELAGPAPDWDNLVIEGVTTSPAEAPSLVIVDVIVPTTLGGLSRMVVTATEAAPPELRVLGLVYDDEKFGRYWILERVNEMTQEELESWLVCDAKEGCEGTWTLAKLPDGIRGVLIEGPLATSVVWLDGKTRFDVIGPASTFSAESAMTVADKVVNSSTG